MANINSFLEFDTKKTLLETLNAFQIMFKLFSVVLFVIGLSSIYNHSFGQATRRGSLGLEVGFPNR
jgi:hypothetical protein